MDVTDLVWKEVGEKYAVAVTREVDAELARANARGQGRVLTLMKLYVLRGPVGMKGEGFPFEDRILAGKPPKEVAIRAFKGHQVRVYGDTYPIKNPFNVKNGKKVPVDSGECCGAAFSLVGKSVFLGTAIDIEKKQDNADKEKLTRSANLLWKITQE